jgi:hypothetical protein
LLQWSKLMMTVTFTRETQLEWGAVDELESYVAGKSRDLVRFETGLRKRELLRMTSRLLAYDLDQW